MWTLVSRLAAIGLCLQLAACYPSCTLNGLVAACASQGHYWVPTLPPNITHLYLESNHISEINSSALRPYQQLQELDLGSQSVQLVIRNSAFLRQRKLIRLVLGSNAGLRLEPSAFLGLFNLRKLFLEGCALNESILADSYLQSLYSLEMLNLLGNQIERLRPGRFFSRLRKFTQLNLKLNQIKTLCEDDLVGFRGKHFTVLDLNSNDIARMYEGDFDEGRCGNPFRDVTIGALDLSTNGFNVINTRRFFNAIQGTPIAHLKMSGFIGRGFSFNNLPDPDRSTFEGLSNSTVNHFDLSENFIFALQSAVFSPLKTVRIIDVSKNKINDIQTNAFIGLQGHLRILNLSSNLLGEIYSNTFANLGALKALDLSYNHIGALGAQAFSDLPDLRWLCLTGNSLRNLGSPASLPNLDFLLLGDNRLNVVSGIATLGRSSIHVDIRENRLTNLEDVYSIVTDFKRLENFFFHSNFIKWCTLNNNITMPYNSTLRVLDLSDSSLQMIWAQGTCLDLFDHLNNLIGLNLRANLLTALPQGIFRGLSSIIELDLSSNSLTFLQPDVFPVSLIQVDLSKNFLAYPDPMTFQSLVFLNLAENRFYCDCHLESFLQWLNVTNVTLLSPAEGFRCEFPAAVHDLALLDYGTIVEPCEKDDEQAVQDLRFGLFIFSALLITTTTLGGLLHARLRGHIFVIYRKLIGRVLEGPKQPPPAEELQYDVFFCFSNNDYGWVEAALLKKFDNQFSEENIFHCCFEVRDFLPGEDHLSNIRDAIWGSRKTVCVISKEFLKDGWCLEAFTLAQSRMVEELTNVLILLVVGKVAHYQLMRYRAIRAFVQKREYLTWPEDPQDLEWFYERLISQILRNTKMKFAEDKSPPAQPQPHKEDDVELEDIRAVAV